MCTEKKRATEPMSVGLASHYGLGTPGRGGAGADQARTGDVRIRITLDIQFDRQTNLILGGQVDNNNSSQPYWDGTGGLVP